MVGNTIDSVSDSRLSSLETDVGCFIWNNNDKHNGSNQQKEI